ncbi:hypothetical protein, partial [Burkholderia ubonensis]|uniref:hypothetical protein n=1 Tax=Burkholderia ubonensis TaxID=101571 RepID=UPI000A9144CB
MKIEQGREMARLGDILTISGSALPTWGGRPVLSARRLFGTDKLGKLYRYTLELTTVADPTLPL